MSAEKLCERCGEPEVVCRKRTLAGAVVHFSRCIVAGMQPKRIEARDVGFALVMWDTEEEPTVVQFATYNGNPEGIAEVLEKAATELRSGTHNLVPDPESGARKAVH